jgi:hypothetical protein
MTMTNKIMHFSNALAGDFKHTLCGLPRKVKGKTVNPVTNYFSKVTCPACCDGSLAAIAPMLDAIDKAFDKVTK